MFCLRIGIIIYYYLFMPLMVFFQDSVQRGIESLRAAWRAVRRLALFSRNETKDDLATAALKFLLIPFYLSEVLFGVKCVLL